TRTTQEEDILVYRAGFDDLIQKDDQFLAEREAWYTNMFTALDLAKEYKKLFTDGGAKLKDQRIPRPPGEPKVKVGGVRDGKIEFIPFKIPPDGSADIILRTTWVPIEDLPPQVLQPLAAVIWGGENTAGLQIREAAFFILSARHD